MDGRGDAAMLELLERASAVRLDKIAGLLRRRLCNSVIPCGSLIVAAEIRRIGITNATRHAANPAAMPIGLV